MSEKTPSEITRAIAEVGDRSDRRSFLRAAAAGAGVALLGGGTLTACGGGGDSGATDGMKTPLGSPKSTMSTPIISCGGVGNDYIDVQVCTSVGGTGAPAGFSLQWMTCDAFAVGTSTTDPVTGVVTVISAPGLWPTDSDAAAAAGVLCKASFSGNANLSRYNLAAGECVTVRIGGLLLDEGASTNCPDPLSACTCYVFRAFAHATSAVLRSAFTPNQQCFTGGCESACDPNVKSFGYWKNHFPDSWPQGSDSMSIGCQTYTAAQLESILLQSPAGGNALVALAHQVINTRLNILNGASQAYIDATAADLAAAEALMCTTGAVPPVGAGSLTGAQAGALTLALDGERGQFECA